MSRHKYSEYKEYYRLKRLKKAQERINEVVAMHKSPEWEPIPKFTSYMVNKDGVIINKYGKKMTHGVHKNNYRHVSLVGDDGIPKHVYVHIVVWSAFKGPISDGKRICHLDADPSNNSLDNLAEMTVKDILNKEITSNKRRASRRSKKLGVYKRLKTYKYDENLNLIKTYDSVKQVAEDNHSISSVSLCCSGKQKTHQGYIFSHKKLRRTRNG